MRSTRASMGHSSICLTTTDDEIVSGLSRKIRVASLSQIARTWFSNPSLGYGRALSRVNYLVRVGVLISLTLRVHPEQPLEAAIWSWRPGEPQPPFGILSYRLRSRWREPLAATTVYTASEKAARVYAGHGGRLAHPLQVTHDLHVSAIFLKLRKNSPAEAEGWVSEDQLAPLRRGQKLPDAEIHGDAGRVLKVIEFGGSYAPERVRLVHEDCERRQVPYELW
jgi:hypothetical protein